MHWHHRSSMTNDQPTQAWNGCWLYTSSSCVVNAVIISAAKNSRFKTPKPPYHIQKNKRRTFLGHNVVAIDKFKYTALTKFQYWSTKRHWLLSSYVNTITRHTHTHLFNGPFPGLPRWASTRKVKPGFYWSKRQWVAVASAGPYARLHLAPDR